MANGEWNVAALVMKENLGITPETIDTYRQLAKYNYECGDYQAARDILENYISLHAKPPPSNTSTEQDEDELLVGASSSKSKTTTTQASDGSTGNASMYHLTSVNLQMLQVLWGKLACEILVEDWQAASVAMQAVKTALEELVTNKEMTALQALDERTWLLHWSLFVYWNDTKAGLEQMVDLFFSEKYRQAITTNAPHLLRYLTAAVLLCKRRIAQKSSDSTNTAYGSNSSRLMKSLIHVMQDTEYTDPLVDFVNCLCVKFDFESAQEKLQKCQALLESDFFLSQQTALFMEEARVFVFENYCRIHDKIDLQALGEKLAMPSDQAERWIVDLIRNAQHLEGAKIDSEKKCVVMGGTSQSVYQQVMERTRDLNVRSATLVQNLNSVLQEARKEKAKKERAAREDD